MATPFLGMICLFGLNFTPRGWYACNGQLIAISENDALFALLGTTYGGDGQSTFAVPDLRGRTPIHQGQGPGLSNYSIGQMAGSETVTLLSSQMPIHSHIALANNTAASVAVPVAGNSLAAPIDVHNDAAYMYSSAAVDTSIAPNSISSAGGNQPHENMQPFLAMNYCIAAEGIFPVRS
jgi:microcystin-dependent protein